jgi:hypothetical protein
LLLEQISIEIKQFSEKTECSPEQISDFLRAISIKNIELHYDYEWQYERKNIIFKEIVNHFLSKLDLQFLSNQYFSVNTIANIFSSLTLRSWNQIAIPAAFIENLVTRAEFLFLQGNEFDEDKAFNILNALCDLNYRSENSGIYPINKDPKSTIVISRAQFFAELAKIALPSLLTVSQGPFKRFDYRFEIFSRTSKLLQLIPRPDYSINTNLFHETIRTLNEKYEWYSEAVLFEALPDEMVPNKELLIALAPDTIRFGNAPNRTFEDESFEMSSTSRNFNRPDGRWIHNHLRHFSEYVITLSKEGNPRALAWSIEQFSKNVIFALDKNHTSYKSDDIACYLKTIRDHAFDISNDNVCLCINALCKEILTNIAELTPNIALYLLWLNMVLSVASNKKEFAYSLTEQSILYKMLKDLKTDKDQARALFEIRLMGWHGNIPFYPELSIQIDALSKSFQEDSNPSREEENARDEIKKNLYDTIRGNLYHDYICRNSGREVDIAYIDGPNKIAINIEGPHHFDPITHKVTIKTIFRDRCLECAGWKVINVDLLTENYLQRSREIASDINKLYLTPPSTKLNRISKAPIANHNKENQAQMISNVQKQYHQQSKVALSSSFNTGGNKPNPGFYPCYAMGIKNSSLISDSPSSTAVLMQQSELNDTGNNNNSYPSQTLGASSSLSSSSSAPVVQQKFLNSSSSSPETVTPDMIWVYQESSNSISSSSGVPYTASHMFFSKAVTALSSSAKCASYSSSSSSSSSSSGSQIPRILYYRFLLRQHH